MPAGMLDDTQAAEYLSKKANRAISKRTIMRWRHAGLIAYRRIGQSPRMLQADLDAFLERDVVPAKEPA